MRLAFQFLNNVCNVNDFAKVNALRLQSGNPSDLYFQIIDLDKGTDECPLRHIPLTGSTVTVNFTSIDSNKNISRIPTQPFLADDRSIWKVSILPTDKIAPNSMTITLVEGANTYTLNAHGDLVVDPTDGGRFFC